MSRAPVALTALILACAPRAPGPPTMNLVKSDWGGVTAFLDSAIAAGAAPGAVLGVSVAGNRFLHATGQLGADEPVPVTPSTVYDLASLTKVVGLVPAIMLAVEEGILDLDAPVNRYVPGFAGDGKEQVTGRLLLAHASGMPAWTPLFREAADRPRALQLASRMLLEAPPGTREIYSDLGLIVLTQAVESVAGQRLDALLQQRVFGPLGMTSVGYAPPVKDRERIAPTELDPWRGHVLRGEVHDENAAVLEGVSGHAGLFGSADDLLTFAEWLLEGWNEGRREGGEAGATGSSFPHSLIPPFPRSLIQSFTRRQDLVPGSSRALGWDTPSAGGSAGRLLSPTSFGHTGFTGTSLWIDPERQLAIVLLSNRVNPTRNNPRWNPVRARIADLVMTTLFEDAR